ATRLIGAVLMDIHEEWLGSSRKYIKFFVWRCPPNNIKIKGQNNVVDFTQDYGLDLTPSFNLINFSIYHHSLTKVIFTFFFFRWEILELKTEVTSPTLLFCVLNIILKNKLLSPLICPPMESPLIGSNL